MEFGENLEMLVLSLSQLEKLKVELSFLQKWCRIGHSQTPQTKWVTMDDLQSWVLQAIDTQVSTLKGKEFLYPK